MMMERKRNADTDSVLPPAKRHNSSSLNVDNSLGGGAVGSGAANKEIKFGAPESPFRYDLDTFQKDALYRNWQLAKLDKKQADKDVEALADRNHQLKDLMVKLDSELTQVLDEANILTGELSVHGAITYPSEEDYENGLEAPEPHTFISALLQKDAPKEQSSLIDDKFTKVRDLLKSIISRIPRAHAPEVLQLQSQLARVAAAEKVHIEQYEKLSALLEEEKRRRETSEYKAFITNTKLGKIQSQVVQYMEWQARSLGKSGDESAKTNGSAVNGTGVEHSAAVHAAEAVKLSALAEAKKRAEQVEALETEKLKLTEELTAANARARSLTDDDFANTHLFKLIKSKYEDVVKKADDLEKMNSELREETQKLRSERTQFQSDLEKETRERCDDLEGQISRNASEIMRLRQDRDNKYNEKVGLELTQNRHDGELADLKSENETLETQIKLLESELEQLRGNMPNGVSSSDDVEGKSEEELRAELKRSLGMIEALKQDMSSMQGMVEKLRKAASPMQQKILRLEGELDLVKGYRAKLQQKALLFEVQIDAKKAYNDGLKVQLGKSTSAIASINETNQRLTDAAAVAERIKEELNAQIGALTAQNRELQAQVGEARLQHGQARAEREGLAEQLSAKDRAVADAERARRSAEAVAEGVREELKSEKTYISGMVKNRGNPSEEVDMLRKVVYCSVCNKNIKNTMLRPCNHVMCSGCAKTRILNRQRKCPICMKPFGEGDLVPVHLV